MAPTNDDFIPTWSSPPGDTINDILEERDLSVHQFAQSMESPLETIDDLLHGRSPITLAIARKLERVLGASVTFWMARDFQFRENLGSAEEDKRWLRGLPLSDMLRFRWLDPIPRPVEELTRCLQFFNVSSVVEWNRKYIPLQQGVAFRTSPSFDSNPLAVAAWLRKGEIEAEKIQCASWNPEKFKNSLREIRALSKKKQPAIFIPLLQSICAKAGVAVVIVRAPTGCRASGATRFVSKDKGLIQLSFRYLSDDHFWFTFFHEVGHLLLHGDRKIFIEAEDMPSTTEEEEANIFSGQVLIPTEVKQEFLSLSSNAMKVIKFAHKIGISPGIVVGQLQHFGRLRPTHLNGLKRRFSWGD